MRRQRVPGVECGGWIERREGFRRGIGIVVDGMGVVETRQVVVDDRLTKRNFREARGAVHSLVIRRSVSLPGVGKQ